MLSRVLSVLIVVLFSLGSFAQFTGVSVTGNNTALTDIFMVDASIGYAGGVDGIFKTTNGGVSWSLLPNFVSLAGTGIEYFTAMNEISLYFLDTQVGYAVGWNASGNFEEIIKTTDGGATWQVQHLINPDTSPFQPIEKRLRDINVFDSNKSIVVGYRGRILKTINGGASWTVKSSGTTKNLEAVSFLNNNIGIAAGNGVVLTTTDGGETWTTIAINYAINDVAYQDINLITATTFSGNIIQSTDGGATWAPNSFKSQYGVNKLFFLNSQVGFVAGNGILLKTTDGGKHFEKYHMNYSNNQSISLTSMHALVENRIYAVTNRGELFSIVDKIIPFIPISGFTSSKTTTCDNSNLPINFLNQGRADYQYQWLINKKLVSTTYDYSTLFPIAGTFKVSLVAYNGIAYDSSSISISVITTLPITKEIQIQLTTPPNVAPDTIETKAQQNYNNFYALNLQEGVAYQAFRNGVAISTKKTATNVDIIRYQQIQIPDVTVGGTFDFLVTAELPSTCGVATSQKGFSRVLLDVPIRPTGLAGFHLANNGTRLDWYDHSVQETYYQVERRAEDEAHYQVIGNISGGGQMSFYDYGPLVTHKRYFYRIAGGNSFGLSKYSNIVSMFMHGDIIYVNPNAAGNNNGSSWQDAMKDLSQALHESTLDDEVWVIKGTYFPDPARPWIASATRGVFGGFNGTETNRDQRNWKVNKTVLSGDIGKAGDLTDNVAQVITIQNGNLSGFTVNGGKLYGAGITGKVSDCVIESNATGISAVSIDKCVIRNNKIGIQGYSNYDFNPRVAITNSFIYNNSQSGFEGYETGAEISNCMFYANHLGSIKANYTNKPSGNVIEIYNSVFGYRENDATLSISNGNTSINHSITGTANPSYGGITYRMSYISGDDGVLGNDDDLLYFPEPLFQNAGQIWPASYFSFFGSLSKDFFYNPRVRDSQLDIGPAEFLPDTIKVPTLQAKETLGIVELNWPRVQSGVTRIWLERKEFDNDVTFIPLPASATYYKDVDVKLFKEYTYTIRLQKGSVVSFPGNEAPAKTYPKVSIQAKALNNFFNEVTYSYSHPYPIKAAQLQVSVDNVPGAFQFWSNLTVSNQVSSYRDYYPKPVRSYRILAIFDLPGGATTGTFSDEVTITALTNQAPSITGQTPSSIIQGNNFPFTPNLIQIHDDYDFPLGYSFEILTGDHYTTDNFIVTPETAFTGNLIINVRITDKDLYSDVYPFVLEVKPNLKPVITSQFPVMIVQGNQYKIETNDIIVNDDFNFPTGISIQILPDANYTLANDGSVIPASSFSGLLEVFIQVSDGFQNSDVYKFQIVVDPLITGDFTTNTKTIIQGSTADFTSTSTGNPTSWHWQFDGGNPSTSEDANPKNIQYNSVGTFKVQLQLQNDLQNITIEKEGFVTVSAITEIVGNFNGAILLYPNPSTDEFFIQSEKEEIISENIKITTLVGQEIKAPIEQKNSFLVKIILPKGEYIISVIAGGEVVQKKAIIH